MLRRRLTCFIAAAALVAALVGCSVSSPKLGKAPAVTTGTLPPSTTLGPLTTAGPRTSTPPSFTISTRGSG